MKIEDLKEFVESNLLKDKFLTPVVFISSPENNFIVDLTEGLKSDESKDMMYNKLVGILEEVKAYKIIWITEMWVYAVPKDLSKEEIEKLKKDRNYRKLEKKEGYSISEITRDKARIYQRMFDRDEKGDIVLGEEMDMTEMEKDVAKNTNFHFLMSHLASTN